MCSKFELGEYKLKNKQDVSHICITKRTMNYIHLHIKEYHWRLYSIYDTKLIKKIFIDEDNNEYIKNIYYNCWSIFTQSKPVLDTEYSFDYLQINSTELENITE